MKLGRGISLHIQTRNSSNIPLDHFLTRLHLRKQLRISNNPRRILHFSTRLIQPRNYSNNRALKDVRQVRDVLEAHSARPFVDDFHESEPRTGDKVVGIVRGEYHLVVGLALVYLLGDLDDGLHPFFEIPGEVGYHVCLFLEDEGGEEGHDFGRIVGCEDIVEDELSEDELVGRVDLAGYFPFQLHAGAVVDEVEVLEDLEALLVVGEELEVLVGHELAELRDIFFDKPLIMTHGELEILSIEFQEEERVFLQYPKYF